MAKRGLAFYFVMSIGVNAFVIMFYYHFKYALKIEEKDMFDYYKKMENKEVLLTESQVRLQGERVEIKTVKFKDEDGYL